MNCPEYILRASFVTFGVAAIISNLHHLSKIYQKEV